MRAARDIAAAPEYPSPGHAVSDIIAEIQRSVAILAESDDKGALNIAQAIALWVGNDSVTFPAALGLPHDWRNIHRRECRDRLLHELVQTDFPGLRGRTLARAVAAAVRG